MAAGYCWQGLLVEVVWVRGCRAMRFPRRCHLSDTSMAQSRGPVRSAPLQPEPMQGVGWSWQGEDVGELTTLGGE